MSGEERRMPGEVAAMIEQHDLDRDVAAGDHAERRLLRDHADAYSPPAKRRHDGSVRS